MELIEGRDPTFVIADEFGSEIARWQGNRDFLVTTALAINNNVQMALFIAGKPVGQFEITAPHVAGAFSGDTLTFDDEMDRQAAHGIHDLIEQGALLAVD